MADKLMSGLGRELRYMEYKLRKKHSDWDKERKKMKQNQADKKYPSMKEFSSSSLSADFTESIPSDQKEENLQIQVALAISKEEMETSKQQQELDRVRLEMAIKESENAMAEAEAKIKSSQQPPNDPWSSTSVQTSSASPSFDPFGTSDWSDSIPKVETPAGVDLWSKKSPQKKMPVKDDFSDLFSSSVSASQPTNDPWASSEALSSNQNSFNPFNDSIVTSNNQFGSNPTTTNQFQTSTSQFQTSNNQFQTSNNQFQTTTNQFQTSTNQLNAISTSNQPDFFNQTPSFDPLAEFDTLTINNSSQQPVSTTNQPIATGFPPMMEPFLLEPVPISSQQPTNPQPSTESKADNFLHGNFNNLVNIDQLLPSKSATNPYMISKPSPNASNISRNPFRHKPPAPSLNQMQGGNKSNQFFQTNQTNDLF